MKRILFSLAILSGTWSAHAAPYGRAGCGLGSLLIKEDSKMQIFASTTNGSSYSQLFGISSGTSNCVPGSKLAALSRQEHFVSANLNNLYLDMAKGQGPTLEAFASTLGCQAESLPLLQETSHSHVKEIFQAPGANAVLDRAKDILSQNPALVATCPHLT